MNFAEVYQTQGSYVTQFQKNVKIAVLSES